MASSSAYIEAQPHGAHLTLPFSEVEPRFLHGQSVNQTLQLETLTFQWLPILFGFAVKKLATCTQTPRSTTCSWASGVEYGYEFHGNLNGG
jgi:hypothetical protein